MNTYNPMLDYQRNNLMAQQQMIQNQLNQLNMQRQTFNPYPQHNDLFFVRQVGSIEEVKGYPVEPQTIYLFPDTGTGDIYLKRLNTENGKSEIIIYKAHSESENVVQKPLATKDNIDSKLESIEKKIGDVYESISSLKIYDKPNRDYAATNVTKDATAEPTKVQPDTANVEWKE